MRKLPILLSLFLGQELFGFQIPSDSIQKTHTLKLNQGLITTSSRELPFWMEGNNSNRFKKRDANFIYGGLLLNKDANKRGALDYFYGIEWLGTLSGKSNGSFIQNYIGVSYSRLLFTLGQKEEFIGYNSTLGFGNLVNGNNARPIPKFSIQTQDWFPLIKSFVSIKGYIAHGWLEANRFQRNSFLHQKYLHFKFHPKNVPVQFNFGITHNAQWGGRNGSFKQPTEIKDFMRIMIASKGGEGALETDKLNALGNHLGTWDLQIKAGISDNWSVTNYIQWLWEDGSGLKPKNWNAGVYGFSLNQINKSGIVNQLGVEIVNTTNQGGSLDGIGSGPDNFLNNGVYRSGWTYHNQVIGSPIFLILNPENTQGNTINNVITGLSLYSQGRIQNLQYTLSFRQFVNTGTKFEPLPAPTEHNSIALNTGINIKNNKLLVGSEYNWGNYSSKNWGFKVEFQKEIVLKR
ncbi:capsule assembly Wzi family protein [Roseivirga ehrenbergii]|uniref:capsule assembly Wzi family protein n=1 Tax=Roseivirga ehrenbergii (strain DSM 102268 / JCM 13514 / KCTC 12282 / NCIMB 14502 / KMM 6017) TaxID=279360 RepID=UPI0012FD6E1E|nr:capsule assembly Wzi family protein [Roseivirga ehrenbergii]